MASKQNKSAGVQSALTILLKNANQPEARQAALGGQFPSVFSIARSNTEQLLKSDVQLHISEARSLHAKAIAMTAMIARQFREQRLTASVRNAVRSDRGIKGLVDAPTYTDMFNPDWANHCPPDAIEATTSPVAYLADLYREAQAVEATADQERALKLAVRRPDLADLMLDHTALNRVEPTLVLVNDILNTSIRSYLDGISLEDKSVDDVLLETRYPFTLPYERYQQQINYVLNRKQRLPGDPIRAADPAYPYFKEPGVHSLLSDIALIQDSGLGPVQQGLLVEAPHTLPDEGDETAPATQRINPRNGRLEGTSTFTQFFKDNFGTENSYELANTQTFCLRTGLTTDQLDALLSIGPYAPSLSPNVQGEGEDDDVDGSAFGSVYINAGQSPGISIESSEQNGVPVHRLIHCPIERFDRLNRMIRLARWLDLPFDEVDQLLTASQQAEYRAANNVRRTVQADSSAPHLITQDTLRALGLFQRVRSRYKVPAQDFAAMLYGLGVHARGKKQSQFDQVFNSQAMFSIPLILDGTPFIVTPSNEAERQKVDHLCAALGLTYEMYRFVAKVVEQSWADAPLLWSREVVSAFYRLVRLPRYIGLSTIEALALLEVLNDGGSQLIARLAGVPRIASYYASSNTDTLSVIHALADCATWLQDHQWTVAQLCHLALPALTQPVATDAERNLLQQLHARLGSALITDSSFAQIGAPDSSETQQTDDSGSQFYLSEPIDWFAGLSAFIDPGAISPATKGLVKYLNGENDEIFEESLSSAVKGVLDQYGLPVEELHPKITNMIMRARGAQNALLMEGLGGYLDTSADLAKALLFWSGGNRYQLLLEVVRVFGPSNTSGVPIGDEILLVLDALSRRATVCSHLALSPALVTHYVEHPDWFGLPDAGLSLPSLYSLTHYAQALRLSEQSEDTLLNYFRLINTLWENATEGDKRLIRDSAANKLAGFLRWGVRDVLAVAVQLHPDDGVIFTLADFDVLVRVCLLGRHTGLDANALLALHELTPTTSTEQYRKAAALALSCLTDAPPAGTVGEVGQSLSRVITVTPDYLVARRESEFATYTITLQDFLDRPLSDVTVTWTSDLGGLDQPSTVTDENGQASTTLQSGNVMGVAHMVAEYGLGETLRAPVVIIGCDEGSLGFTNPERAPSKALANNIGVISFDVELVDQFGNAGVDQVITWVTTLGAFERYQTLVNGDGKGNARLRSLDHGEASVEAQHANGKFMRFQPVEFESIPYFQFVRFSGVVIVEVETELVCRLVELNGSPVEPETVVLWSADVPGLAGTESKTDAEGYARMRFRASEVGEVVVTVSSDDANEPKSTSKTTIYQPVEIERYEASTDYYVVGSGDPVIFTVWLRGGGELPAGFPIEWSVDGKEPVTIKADGSGVGRFSERFEQGPHTIVATVGGGGGSCDFSVVGGPYFTCDAKFVPDLIDGEMLYHRVGFYTLTVTLMDGSGDSIAGIPFTLESVGADPGFYNVYCPDFGKVVTSTRDGYRFAIGVGINSYNYLLGDIKLRVGRSVSSVDLDCKVGERYTLLAIINNQVGYYIGAYVQGGDYYPLYPQSQTPDKPEPTWFKERDLVFSCPSRSWQKTVRLRWVSGRPYWSLPWESEGPQIGDTVSITELSEADGYVFYIQGDTRLNKL
ncbi:Tc toxin subunit A [Pseudomonas sp. Pseusp122]|uniref:Tc toxin subunit A n=1 Tax=unclassified Pseudomonas TaxID=196821 RepID=UPI0039A6D5FC